MDRWKSLFCFEIFDIFVSFLFKYCCFFILKNICFKKFKLHNCSLKEKKQLIECWELINQTFIIGEVINKLNKFSFYFVYL